MNKSEIKKIMKAPFSEVLKEIKDKDVAKELKALDNLQSVCEDLGSLVERRKKAITEGKICCSHCKKYFKPNPKKQYANTHIENRTSYIDSGYGDDDRFADYEITDLYQLCPNCQKPVKVKGQWSISKVPGTERDRRGNRYD